MASPSLIEQGSRPVKERRDTGGINAEKIRQQVDSRLAGMKINRYSWWVHWREIAQYMLPRRYVWLVTPNQGNRGSPINQSIIDETATIASRVCASGMLSGMASPGRPWMRLGIRNPKFSEDKEVKDWLSECTDRMFVVFAESNFYQALAIMFHDLVTFGSAPIIIYEDFDDVIRLYNTAAGEYYLANSYRMDVDTLYREFVMTTKQIADMFGIENCSETVREAVKQGGSMLNRELIVAHGIEPTSDYMEGAKGLRGMKWREVYWEYGSGQTNLLRYRGYHDKPFIAPRWDITGNDAYGRSPGMDALPGTKQLQLEQKRKAQAIDKQVNPPLLADVDLKNEPATQTPGGITYVKSTNGIGMKPIYMVAPNIREMTEDIREIQDRIKTIFYNDLFLMISQLDTVRTATEIDARREEKLIQLGPVLERLQTEGLDPLIDRTFNIMLRAGLLPPIPPQLRGQHIRAEYVSILADAQKAIATAGIERFMAFVGNVSAGVPAAMDNINIDDTINVYHDKLSLPPKLLNDQKQVAGIRDARNQQQQQDAMMQNSLAAAQGAATLSKADLGSDNALQKIVGGGLQ